MNWSRLPSSAQLAFLINSLALADRAEETLGIRPDLCAGPSFGQKAAAVYAESVDFADMIRMTAELARCEQEYFATEYSDVVAHSVVRVPEEPFHELLASMAERGEWFDISGYLDRGFYLISLRERGLEDFKQAIRAMGGYSMYTMRPPVHAAVFGVLRRKVEVEVFGDYTHRGPEVAGDRRPGRLDRDHGRCAAHNDAGYH